MFVPGGKQRAPDRRMIALSFARRDKQRFLAFKIVLDSCKQMPQCVLVSVYTGGKKNKSSSYLLARQNQFSTRLHNGTIFPYFKEITFVADSWKTVRPLIRTFSQRPTYSWKNMLVLLQTPSVEISNATRPGVVGDAKADVLPEKLPPLALS